MPNCADAQRPVEREENTTVQELAEKASSLLQSYRVLCRETHVLLDELAEVVVDGIELLLTIIAVEVIHIDSRAGFTGRACALSRGHRTRVDIASKRGTIGER